MKMLCAGPGPEKNRRDGWGQSSRRDGPSGGGERERWATPSLLSLEGADMVALQQGASLKFCRKIKVTPVESKRGKGKWN